MKFHIVGMKEPDYVMMIMTTYGTSVEFGDERNRHYMVNGVKHVTMFRYPEVVYNHYCYRDVIDNHNSFRNAPAEYGGNNTLAKQSFLFPLGNHHGECPKCGNLLLKQA